MSTYVYQTPTNNKPDSRYDVLGHLMPARIFFFVVVEEPGRDGYLVRRCYTSIEDPYLQKLQLDPLQLEREVFPEKYGLWGKGPNSTASVAEHVMGYEKITRYASTSSEFPEGAGRMQGKVIYVDIAQAKRAGAKLVTTQEIKQSLQQYAQENPHLKNRILHKADYQPYGVHFSGTRSFKAKSIRPIEKEVVRQTGGWGGAIMGARIGASAGALVGIETGPGSVITGAIGGIMGGAVGYFGGRVVANEIPNR
ncbi:glycine zipper family protein [Paraburkholderia sp. SIMBA_030]|uniref:glycine zipper family protein n=1 Tax=Paraburkholderia sp. SIMBA_030 TaxID=3085773 RepID=UPI00397DDD85